MSGWCRWLGAALAVAAQCGCGRYWVCEGTDAAGTEALPETLSATGLFAADGALGEGVVAYRPQFELWSDGADKRRWIRLPPGGRIDTRDMDAWIFPAGTRLWKEFRHGDLRVETRLLEKRGDGDHDWIGLSYLWDEDERDAHPAPYGVIDARGTQHDVPASGECMGCHGGRRSRVLGFSAIQLSAAAGPGELGLAELIDRGLLSHPPAAPFQVPGDATERAALGYLHANCGHCHNDARPASDGPRCFDPDDETHFQLSTRHLGNTADTSTYRSAIGGDIEPGDPDDSRLIELVSERGFSQQMPPLATERVDAAAVELLRTWIAQMGPER